MFKGYFFNKQFEQLNTLKKRKDCFYLDKAICLDTETSHNHDEDNPKCWIYQWAFEFNRGLYYGRTPEQLMTMLSNIVEYYELNEQKRVLIFVHNLAYDISYLMLYLYEWFGNPTFVLATDNNHIFCIQYGNGLEFRCSYKLSNNSLDKWSKNVNTQYKKLVNGIDYDVIRNQNTPLTRRDWKYQLYDVIVQSQALDNQLELYADNLASIPLTSTGYTRREISRSYKGKVHRGRNKNRDEFIRTKMTKHVYELNRTEFSGGLTIGNFTMKGKIQEGDIRHRDFRSDYPTQQRIRTMPCGQWVFYADSGRIHEFKTMNEKYCMLIKIVINDMGLYKHVTMPYAQTSHFLIATSSDFRYISENGRIIATKGASEVVLSYEEIELLKRQYRFDYEIKEVWINKRNYLPAWLTDVIDEHFKGKTDFKEKLEAYTGDDIIEKLNLKNNLMKSKNVINGIYGVSATDPVKVSFVIDKNKCRPEGVNDIQKSLNKFYNSYNNCMRYSWGCFTTIYARLQLVEIVENIIGYENFIYSDTDSIYYYSTPEIEKSMEEYNKKCYDDAIQKGAYITTDAGTIVTYNSFDEEVYKGKPERIKRFKFLHAKCYAYETDDGQLHSTIAGVTAYNSKTGVTREQELNSLEELEDKKQFVHCGGTKAKYIATDFEFYEGNSTCGGCIITPTTKTLKATEILDREDVLEWLVE